MALLGLLWVSALLLLCCCSSLVCAALPDPRNPTIHTLNTNYMLKWDWDVNQTHDSTYNVTFTVQSLAKFKLKKPKKDHDWQTLCQSTSERQCDFSSAKPHYLGVWLLRLRAESGRNTSSWVRKEFCPDRDADIGPPSAVNVTAVKHLLQVAITDPLTYTNGTMKEWLPNMYYFIEYWRKGSSTTKPDNLTSVNNLVILSGLESWTWYCVRVRSMDDYYKKRSVFSPAYCKQTDGQTPYWQIVLFFLFSLGLSFLLGLGLIFCICRVGKVIKNTFFPTVPLPAAIQEYLCDLSRSETPRLLPAEPELEICSDKLDILTPEVTDVPEIILEVHLPLETSQQSGRGLSRRSSYDSGVYSTEGSGPRQNELGEARPDQPGNKMRAEEPDEGVQDLSVVS